MTNASQSAKSDSSDDASRFDILVVGFDPSLMNLIQNQTSHLKLKLINKSTEVENFLESFQLAAGSTVLISTATQGMTHLEVGQALSSYFQGVQIVFVTMDRNLFAVESLKKNGFTESFLIPTDSKIFNDLLDGLKNSKQGGGSKRFKAVKLVDIQAGQNLPFEVRTYLPSNNKYVVVTGTGQLSQKKVDLLKKSQSNSVYIDKNQVEKFYEYAAEQLIQSGNTSNDAVSETEKTERLQSSVRHLFRSILDTSDTSGDFEKGRDLSDQSKKIVDSYMKQKTGLDLSKKLKEITGEGRDAYSHAQLVSTIACLLSMASGIGQPEDLAIAGLFHDIGIQGLREDISIFDLAKLSEEDKKTYMLHPKNSLNLLKEKKVTLTQLVADVIEKHHERVDGKGFPNQLAAHKIPPEAHLLAYADAFEYLTRSQPGKKAMTPQEVHQKITQELGLPLDILRKLEQFLESATK